MNSPPHQAKVTLCHWMTAASWIHASYEYILVQTSLAPVAIFQGRYQESPYAPQMLYVQVRLQHHPFTVQPLPECSMQLYRTSYLFHGSSRLGPPIRIVSIREAISASDLTPPQGAVMLWRLGPSPSPVHPLCSACPALHHHHAHLPHPPQHWNLQDCSDCLRYHSSSVDMFSRGLWLWILRFEFSSYLPATA